MGSSPRATQDVADGQEEGSTYAFRVSGLPMLPNVDVLMFYGVLVVSLQARLGRRQLGKRCPNPAT